MLPHLRQSPRGTLGIMLDGERSTEIEKIPLGRGQSPGRLEDVQQTPAHRRYEESHRMAPFRNLKRLSAPHASQYRTRMLLQRAHADSFHVRQRST